MSKKSKYGKTISVRVSDAFYNKFHRDCRKNNCSHRELLEALLKYSYNYDNRDTVGLLKKLNYYNNVSKSKMDILKDNILVNDADFSGMNEVLTELLNEQKDINNGLKDLLKDINIYIK